MSEYMYSADGINWISGEEVGENDEAFFAESAGDEPAYSPAAEQFLRDVQRFNVDLTDAVRRLSCGRIQMLGDEYSVTWMLVKGGFSERFEQLPDGYVGYMEYAKDGSCFF